MNEELILSKLEDFKCFFEENKVEHKKLSNAFADAHKNHEERIRAIEDWKLVFVAKYTVYSAIALFLGSTLATIGMQIISNLL